jgi:hypothetical protein
MLLGISPNSQTQGLVLSIGITIAFIIAMSILPPLMLLQRRYIYTKADEILFSIAGRTEEAKKSPIDKFLSWVANMQIKSPLLVISIVILVTIALIHGFGLVYLDTDGENWIPDGDDVLEALENVGYNFGGTESMNLIFMIDNTHGGDYDPNSVRDLRDPRVLLPMSNLDELVQDLRWVDSVDSPSGEIKDLNEQRVPQELEEIKKIVEQNPSADFNYNDDYSIALFTPRFDSISRENYFELLDELNGVTFPSEVAIVPQGQIPEDIEFEETMGNDTINVALIGFVLVILIASLFYRSIIYGLLSFIPIVFAIIWTVGAMGLINLPFTVLTTGMLAILMGMGIDFSIHIIHSIKEKMKIHHNSLQKAIPEALMSTGQAIAVTTITTVLGFMALSFATLVNTMRLGWTLRLGIGMTFFSCILIVPAIMAIKYKMEMKKNVHT